MNEIEKIRHSLAHLLAMAAIELDPAVKLGIGPTIENGFYYDLLFSQPISDLQLPTLERSMRKIAESNLDFTHVEATPDQARKMFSDQPFKLELIDELESKGEQITLYSTGNAFTDLCRGGHVENTSEIAVDAFALTRTAGAYWRGSEKNPMLSRIYGVAFDSKTELDSFIEQQEQAKLRDHRVLAEKLDLFMVSEDVGKGLPLWLPNGAFIRKKLEDYIYDKETTAGYKYVNTPVLTHKRLYEQSGHLAHYNEDMYNPIEIEGEEYYLRPMNCPHHHQIFKHRPHSYRDLPLRLAEAGLVHRFERSGVLTGLVRARCFTQNDAHIYCAQDDLHNELMNILRLFNDVYSTFEIKDYWFRLSLPDFSNKEKFGDIEDQETWNVASNIARGALNEFGARFVEGEGEAAFYGPKIDVQLRNVNGKEDTIATVQIDFYSAKRFDLSFINAKGEKEYPVIVHRAIMGSFDRFFAFLTEQYGGNFPLWLAPTQITVLPVSAAQLQYSQDIQQQLTNAGYRVSLSEPNDGLGKRIHKFKEAKIPYALVLGGKEVEANTVSVESRDTGKLGAMPVTKFIDSIKAESRLGR